LCKIKTPDVQEGRENGVDVVNASFASCPGDTWVILNTTAQGWGLDRLTTLVTGKGNEAFTLRASWPASVRFLSFSRLLATENVSGCLTAVLFFFVDSSRSFPYALLRFQRWGHDKFPRSMHDRTLRRACESDEWEV
jgi:hypothetical protein